MCDLTEGLQVTYLSSNPRSVEDANPSDIHLGRLSIHSALEVIHVQDLPIHHASHEMCDTRGSLLSCQRRLPGQTIVAALGQVVGKDTITSRQALNGTHAGAFGILQMDLSILLTLHKPLITAVYSNLLTALAMVILHSPSSHNTRHMPFHSLVTILLSIVGHRPLLYAILLHTQFQFTEHCLPFRTLAHELALLVRAEAA